MAEKKVPKVTAKRFPIYLKYLNMLAEEGIEKINSLEFSKYTNISAPTIRRDFSHLGDLGKSGYGYDVNFLIQTFEESLRTQEKKHIAIVGCGNLGRAFLRNNFRRNENIEICAAFDNNPVIIGEVISGVKVESMQDLQRVVQERKISLVITTVPSQYAKSAIEEIVASGVKSILNFAPVVLDLPSDVTIQTIDLTNEVQTLLFLGE